MSESQQSQQQAQNGSGTPPPPTTRTVVVTASPPLIPDETENAYCLTRRGVFDTIIALILVGGIIYFVVQYRRGSPMFTGLSGMFGSTGYGNRMGTGTGMGMGSSMRTGTSGFGTGARSGFGTGMGTGFGTSGFGQQMNRMGNQLAGAMKKLFN